QATDNSLEARRILPSSCSEESKTDARRAEFLKIVLNTTSKPRRQNKSQPSFKLLDATIAQQRLELQALIISANTRRDHLLAACWRSDSVAIATRIERVKLAKIIMQPS